MRRSTGLPLRSCALNAAFSATHQSPAAESNPHILQRCKIMLDFQQVRLA